jgi:hypothetical protein
MLNVKKKYPEEHTTALLKKITMIKKKLFTKKMKYMYTNKIKE